VDTTGGDCWVPTAGTPDDITFSVTGTITLTSSLPAILSTSITGLTSVTIDGTGQSITINGLNGLNAYQILSVNSGAMLTLNDLTIENGSSGSYGGGVWNSGTLNVTNSTFSGNSAGIDGGGVWNSGTLNVTNSTFSGNIAGIEGGGIYNILGTVNVTNSTFSGNSGGDGGGIYNDSGTTTVTNSILATDTGGNCAGFGTPPVTDGGYNISDDTTCGFTATGSSNSTNPLLATAGLVNNGGPTQTIALQAASPAVDVIPSGVGNANCPGFDQRGDPRPAPGFSNCDIGAYELQPIIVNTLADTGSVGVCALRDAITAANSQAAVNGCAAGTGNDLITFSVTGTILLGSTLTAITNTSPASLTIDGTGQNIIINGGGTYGVLSVSGGATLTLNDLTIENGSATFGGGIENNGTLTVTNSTFSGNNASANGGGIYNEVGTLNLTNSTFSANSAGNVGGGVWNSGTLNVTNSTFSANSGGVGIYNSGTATVTNSILAADTGGNCSGTIADGGYNISDDATCGFTATGSANSKNPLLAAAGLANNGGPTYTIALQSTSPAIDVIPSGSANCPGFDQRGAPRPAPTYTDCDIGAYEYGGVVP